MSSLPVSVCVLDLVLRLVGSRHLELRGRGVVPAEIPMGPSGERLVLVLEH